MIHAARLASAYPTHAARTGYASALAVVSRPEETWRRRIDTVLAGLGRGTRPGANHALLCRSIADNQRLWADFASHAMRADSGYDNETRGKILSLLNFVIGHGSSALAGQVSAEPLKEITAHLRGFVENGRRAAA